MWTTTTPPRTEPTLLPVTFPTILANNTLGIAVGMASSICSFNLAELCETTIALLKNPDHDIRSTLPAPDFVGGGYILYNEEDIGRIYETGRGGVRVRARYEYQKDGNMIEVTQIPPTTTIEAIMDKIAELVKSGRVKEISDMRDETDLNGLKLTIDLKRGQDADKVMQKLFRMTPLEDSFPCNFNILISGMPRVMGVREISGRVGRIPHRVRAPPYVLRSAGQGKAPASAARAWRPFCWISTRLCALCARPKRKPRWCPT